ncbi:MAG: transposase family protein [Oscillospiraceae bacterium]|nr:transposase family protein [Oscillospiraceae bacterium]
MGNILAYLDLVQDNRQGKKVLHKMSDIIALVFFALLANADEWTAIEVFGKEHEEFFAKIFGIAPWNTLPRHN